MTNAEIFHARESGVRSYCRSFDAVFTRAHGSVVEDETGREFIDLLAGCSSLNYGHNDPDMTDALVAHIQSGGLSLALDTYTDAKRSFLETFTQRILEPRQMPHRVHFTGPTGANAVEAALKLARKVTGRSSVIAFTNGFHGCTLGALAATGNQHHRMNLPLPGIARAAFDGYFGPDVDTAGMLEQLLNDPSSGFDRPAAILVETVQGEGGLNAASAGWLRKISALAERHGALMIVDDIQAGCGRTGSFFSFETLGFMPDMITMSKSLSGFGLPFALMLMRPGIDQWTPGEHNGTFRGNTHAFVTSKVMLDKFWTDRAFEDTIGRRASIVADGLTRMQMLVPGSRLKGRSMMRGLEVPTGELASEICRQAFELDLILETSGARGQVVKILAPLTTPDELLLEAFDRLEEATRRALASRAMEPSVADTVIELRAVDVLS